MIAAVAEVAVLVDLDLETVDDPGRRRLLLLVLLVTVVVFVRLGGGLVGIGVLDQQGEALAVGGPFVGRDALADVGQRRRLAAAPVERPHLGLVVAAGGEEGEVAPVRAPTRPAGRAAGRGHRQRLAALAFGRRHHPDAGLVLVLFQVAAGHRVGDPSPLRAELRFVDVAEPEVVVDRQVPRRGGRGLQRCGGGRRRGRSRSQPPDPDEESDEDDGAMETRPHERSSRSRRPGAGGGPAVGRARHGLRSSADSSS